MEVATEQEVFERLMALPPDSPYWKNRWMFTKPVFLNESMQGGDSGRFRDWVFLQSKALTNHIYAAPSNAKVTGSPALSASPSGLPGYATEVEK